jgi:outer membrane protein
MKKLVLALALTLSAFSAQAQSKIGTIDADYILSQLPEIEEVNKGLETYSADLQKDLDSTITKYETLIKDYQENGSTLTEEEKKAKEGDIISLENDIKGFRQKASVMLQMRRNELTQPLYEKINAAMLEIVQEEGFTQIIHSGSNALAFSVQDADITVKVLNKLGITVDPATLNGGAE